MRVKRLAAGAAGAAALALGATVMVAPPADALLTHNRCSSFSVDRPFPVPNTTVTLCWQYTYHAQADGTGNNVTNIWIDCANNCGDIDFITQMSVKAINPKTGVVNDSQSINEVNSPEGFPANRSLSLTGRDVGDETIRWNFRWEYNFSYLNTQSINDCVSLADPYSGPCDPV